MSRRIERVMGTAVVTDVRTDIPVESVDEAMGFLRWVDVTFSVYRHDSQISKIGRGDLAPDEADIAVREVLTACAELRSATEGWFDHEPQLAGGRPLDPSGYVKGWAVDRAVDMLADAGARRLSMSAGGDVALYGTSDTPWRVAIQHPERRDAIVAVVGLASGGIATSGLYERGHHIWQPAGRARRGELKSVSVLGPELGIADALATAVFAAGDPTVPWLDRFPDYGVMAVDPGGTLWTSPGVEVLEAGEAVA